ncbi:endolytic transglycosylase MltG [Candidatus Peregrinibacteria bacterium CG10_big_fil_rev_8_21_14_0_10_49_10]|nr:MAG: endolytic transglycosylase MltG [Candidatus Peregrinibacteria bacterium CG10_big_fil_rev_8_21_14_0_10_49_10]
MKRAFLIIIGLVLVGIFSYTHALSPLNAASQDRHTIAIEPGFSVQKIAQLLVDRAIIRSPFAFTTYVRLHGKAASLQAGKFVLRPAMSVQEIVLLLQNGKADEAIITIPEGYTVRQIDALMAHKGFSGTGDILRCARECDFSSFTFLPQVGGLAERGGKIEGYLYPDTYFVSKDDFFAKFFLERLLTTYRNKVIEPYAETIEQSGRTLHELVTMASLIEEETLTNAERPVVSGILWKRYDDGRGLGVDATVRYILDKPTQEITTGDLNTNSPYNTRKFKGLPPGPIANAGTKSFVAALFPKESEYWYYLHGDDGVIHYAVTNEEHNVNRYLYIH